MPGPVLYSANPWYSLEVAEKYRGGRYFAWVCEYFDSERDAPASSAGSLIAPSSNPRKIYQDLLHEFHAQEEHSRIIKDHKRTFQRLAKQWLASSEITEEQFDEIVASVRAKSWRIWKPVIYVIPRASLDPSRIFQVARTARAGYGPEYQIVDLKRSEFDLLDMSALVRQP